MRHWGVSAYAAIPAAALVGLVTGYVFGRVLTRLVGFYLALTTFALALALPQMLKSSYVSPWNRPASMSTRDSRVSSRYLDPVTVRAAPCNVRVMGMVRVCHTGKSLILNR